VFLQNRYLLEIERIPSLVNPIVDILLYISSHSMFLAQKVADVSTFIFYPLTCKCPRLLKVLKKDFVEVNIETASSAGKSFVFLFNGLQNILTKHRFQGWWLFLE
jgi:hypothetical protein